MADPHDKKADPPVQRLLPFFPVVFVLLWSTGFIGARYAMPYAEPFTFLALRFALALAYNENRESLQRFTKYRVKT